MPLSFVQQCLQTFEHGTFVRSSWNFQREDCGCKWCRSALSVLKCMFSFEPCVICARSLPYYGSQVWLAQAKWLQQHVSTANCLKKLPNNTAHWEALNIFEQYSTNKSFRYQGFHGVQLKTLLLLCCALHGWYSDVVFCGTWIARELGSAEVAWQLLGGAGPISKTHFLAFSFGFANGSAFLLVLDSSSSTPSILHPDGALALLGAFPQSASGRSGAEGHGGWAVHRSTRPGEHSLLGSPDSSHKEADAFQLESAGQ